MSAPKNNLKQIGEDSWKRCAKINGELFVFLYGALVQQILRDYEDVNEVNAQIEKIGYNMGIRLIEDFLIKSGISNWLQKCKDFRESVEVVAKVGFKMFLNINPTVSDVENHKDEFILIFEENPLIEYVELPCTENYQVLQYQAVIPGIIRGAFEMLHMQVECDILNCSLLNTSAPTQIKVKLVKINVAELPPTDL